MQTTGQTILTAIGARFRRATSAVNYWSRLGRAKLWRLRLRPVTFVGITGSAGKTATKDLAAAVLGVLGPCQGSRGTVNQLAGIVDMVLRTTPRHRFSVFELSASRPGYLDRPLRLVQPRIGVLTLVARDHYTAFKSIEGIAQEKGKLIAALPPDGAAVINCDDPLTRGIGERAPCRVIWIGEREDADLRLVSARSLYPEPLLLEVEHEGVRYEVRTELHGRQLALSVLAALGVGLAAGVPLPSAIEALGRARITDARMQIIPGYDGVTFVRDDWKAPLWSFHAPLEFLGEAQAKRKVAIIGTLSDYSLSASKLYPKIARQVREIADLVVFVGPHALRALKAKSGPEDESILAFPEIAAAAAHLKSALRPGDLVLVKGSHKADHLTRLILDRSEPVLCWDDRCDSGVLCEQCPRLRDSMRAKRTAGGTQQQLGPALPVSQSPRTTGEVAALVIGLGNPEDRENRTPHNIGRRAVDALAVGDVWAAEPEGLVSRISVQGLRVALLKPSAPMNRCGSNVRAFLERSGLDGSRCILVHDDMDLALGEVRIKRDGGDAGHKGVRSILTSLGTGSVGRVRVGVRQEGEQRKARELVLNDFEAGSEPLLAGAVEKAVTRIHELAKTFAVKEAAAQVD